MRISNIRSFKTLAEVTNDCTNDKYRLIEAMTGEIWLVKLVWDPFTPPRFERIRNGERVDMNYVYYDNAEFVCYKSEIHKFILREAVRKSLPIKDFNTGEQIADYYNKWDFPVGVFEVTDDEWEEMNSDKI
ncbi:hypothetical protein [Taylorella asinigenitalis]|uniref:hypothetical protein n=1 Tax=Taylorella asinigenitalis TaxID=84590 RepID=UPI00048DD643|nr:hypothetical protein [Taylorella asinigenitalis]